MDLRGMTEEMTSLEEKENRLKAWFKEIEDIGNTPDIEPGSARKALEGLADNLGSMRNIALCLV